MLAVDDDYDPHADFSLFALHGNDCRTDPWELLPQGYAIKPATKEGGNMFRRRNETADHTITHGPARDVRGGMSIGAIVTGVVVALGAMFLLSAIIGGILVALDVETETLTESEGLRAGIAAGIAFVVAQFLAYLWGGYTAGRMARGAGFAHGLLVPIVALLLGLLAAGLVRLMGAEANLNLPFTVNRLPLETDTAVNWGTGIGIASLVAMLLGGIAGGITGSRWHTKLELRAVAPADAEDRHPIEDERHPVASRTTDDAHAAAESHPVTASPADTASRTRSFRK